MRKLAPTVLFPALALVATALPALAQTAPAVACADVDGRPQLTHEGFEQTFEAPVATWPGLSAPANTSVGPTAALRSAPFSFTTNFAPSADGLAKFRLDWAGASDFDIFVFDDADGTEIGRSAAANIEEGQTTFEEIEIPLTHCQSITAYVRSWAGSPAENLTFKVTVTPGSKLLACAESDPAPGCAGKAAGEAPAFVPDARSRLYLGGDPGQVSMVHAFAGNQSLPQGRLDAARPATGKPNQYTRPLGGFPRSVPEPVRPPLDDRVRRAAELQGTRRRSPVRLV